MTVIAFCGSKGGPGKTTLATNTATWLAQRDSVLLIDADGQSSSAKWQQRRGKRVDVVQVPCIQMTHDLISAVKEQSKHYANIVIDVGGRDSSELRSSLVVADVVVVPVKASQLDLETLPLMASHIKAAQEMRSGVDLKSKAFIVISMAPTNQFIKDEQVARETLSSFDFGIVLPVLSRAICERKAYRDAVADGLSVLEGSNVHAQSEINELAEAIFNV